jgi:hypothetical protein
MHATPTQRLVLAELAQGALDVPTLVARIARRPAPAPTDRRGPSHLGAARPCAANVYALLRRLERRGLVTGRRGRWEITAAGRAVVAPAGDLVHR